MFFAPDYKFLAGAKNWPGPFMQSWNLLCDFFNAMSPQSVFDGLTKCESCSIENGFQVTIGELEGIGSSKCYCMFSYDKVSYSKCSSVA